MRVIRRKSGFRGVEVAGNPPARDPVRERALALERPIGRGGGMRDPLPGREIRDAYVTVSLPKSVGRWAAKQAAKRGLSRSAFLGLLIEAAAQMRPSEVDELVAGPDVEF